jgi:hypothetical protein
MSRLKRWAEIVVLVVVLPFACLFWGAVALAVGVKSVFIFSGSLVAAWMFSAVALPMLFGVLSPHEIVENYQSRRRQARLYEGVPLGGARDEFPFSKVRFGRYWSRRRREKFYPLEPRRLPREGFPFWKGRLTFD